MEAADGLLEGDWVQVTYRGAISGTDTTGVHVDRVVDMAEHTPDIEMTDVDETVYTTGPAGLFAENSTSAEKLADLAKGTQLHRTGKGPHGWSRVEFNGVTGYAASQYLTNVRPGLGATEEQETNETVTTTANLRLHETTDVDSPVVAVMPAGTALHRVAYTADGWSIVLYNGETVYCATEYVTQ